MDQGDVPMRVASKSSAIIVDLDGTLYDCRERRDRYMGGRRKNFDKFHAAAANDRAHLWCKEICLAFRARRYEVVVRGGADTELWIHRELGWLPAQYVLFMRPMKDTRKDSAVKLEIYKREIEPRYPVLFAVDDRAQVVEMWRSIGLTCLQCAPGNF
jgi:hypothetical protein